MLNLQSIANSFDSTLLVHSFISVLLVMAVAVILGFFFSFIRNFAASHNPLGANLINYVTFIGVVHHELSHALLAFLTGAKVTEIKLFRLHHEDGRLGYVAYATRGGVVRQSVQKVMASVAPILMGGVSCYLMYIYVRPIAETSIIGIILFYYVLVSIILHMSLSKQDISVMKGGIVVVILLMTVLFYIFHVDFVVVLNNFMNVSQG